MRKLSLVFLFCFISLSSLADSSDTIAAIRANLRSSLSGAVSTTDSLRIYYDLFDSAPISERRELAETIYRLAVRSHNITAQLEMLRAMANIVQTRPDYDSLLTRYVNLADNLPNDEMQRATVTFIEMLRVTAASRQLSDSARTNYFQREILNYPGDENCELIDQIRHHYAICLFLGGSRRTPLLAENVAYLGQLVQKLPYRQMESVRNLYYTQAARMYTQIGDARRAVAADREMLRGIHAMQQRYAAEGRHYRSYLTSIYNIYRRMLMNASALAPGENDSIYTQLVNLSRQSPDIATALNNGFVSGFYAYSKGRYSQAVPLLEKALEINPLPHYRIVVLRALVDAAQRSSNTAALLRVMPAYIAELEELTSTENLAEMLNRETEYKISEERRRQNAIDSVLKAQQQRDHSILVVGSVIVTLVLLVCLFMLYRLYSRARRLSRTLSQTNAALISERDKLKRSQRDLIAARDRANKASSLKTDFINNMSREVSAPLAAIVEYSQFIVDNMDTGRRKHMQTFADIVVLSAELLQTLVNDVLDTSSIERGEVEINRRPIAVAGMCNMAIGNFRSRMKPGVTLEFTNTSELDAIITTDPQRVEQVLMNLISNAAKFTEEGYVHLCYQFSADRSLITFIVEDTGIGIPEGKEQVIFGRFEKLDSHTQGSGLGLYICSLVAKLLGGEIRVDTSYQGPGARFLFTVPAA